MSIIRNVLPADVKPELYRVKLEPHFDTFTFDAEVDIEVHVERATHRITLNSNKITFSSVEVSFYGVAEPEVVDVATIAVDEENERITITTARAVETSACLHFKYRSSISDNLFGFYRCRYAEGDVTHYWGATQMCPVDARKVFPCWDEPAVKAAFNIEIISPVGMQALSNMEPMEMHRLEDGRTHWRFATTPVMSTYLLAWVVGKMESIETVVKKTLPSESGDESESTLLRLFTTSGKSAQGQFALDVAAKVIPLYEKFFGINFVLPKLDMVALPDFAFGAMENWGLIVYREEALIAPDDMSAAQRERIAIVVAHEIAHQWFGNLVTMEWWKELWLNESFATYIATWAVHKLFPEWHVDVQFLYDEGSRAFQLDALRSSHPVEVDLRNAQEIDGIFDAISYAKGGSVVRMAVEFVGESVFQIAISNYLKKHQLANATTVDLWNALGEADGRDLTSMMQNWTSKQGYPYLQASYSPADKALSLTQHRFLAFNDATPEEDVIVWQIPMPCSCGNLSDDTKTTQQIIVGDRTTTISLDACEWVKVNANQSGFCRVLYTAPMLQALGEAVKLKKLSSADRLGLIADYAAFGRGGYCATSEAMQLLSAYVHEDDFTVWCQVVHFEKSLRTIVYRISPEAVQLYDSFCEKLYGPTMEQLGYEHQEGNDHRTRQLRVLLFGRLVACGNEDARNAAVKMYTGRSAKPIAADMLQIVYGVHIQANGDGAMQEVQDLIRKTTNSSDRSQFLRALAAVPDVEEGVKSLFEFLLSDAVRSQDALYLLAAVADNQLAFKSFTAQLIQQWARIAAKLPSMIQSRVVKLLECGADAALVEPLQTFFDGLPPTTQWSTGMTFKQGLEGLQCNAAWAERDASCIHQYLHTSL